MPVAASWKDILILVDKLEGNLKKVSLYNGTLAVQLKIAEKSFKDEGIEIIQNHISKTKSQIEDAVPEFRAVLKNLTEYARLLKLAEGVTAYQNERTR
jgi:hypothetical protein